VSRRNGSWSKDVAEKVWSHLRCTIFNVTKNSKCILSRSGTSRYCCDLYTNCFSNSICNSIYFTTNSTSRTTIILYIVDQDSHTVGSPCYARHADAIGHRTTDRVDQDSHTVGSPCYARHADARRTGSSNIVGLYPHTGGIPCYARHAGTKRGGSINIVHEGTIRIGSVHRVD
jgi:hypothetical protein